jgi:hypothetical protein
MRSMMFFSGIYQGRRWFAWVHLRVSWFGFAGDCDLRLAAALGFEYWTLVDRVDEHGLAQGSTSIHQFGFVISHDVPTCTQSLRD